MNGSIAADRLGSTRRSFRRSPPLERQSCSSQLPVVALHEDPDFVRCMLQLEGGGRAHGGDAPWLRKATRWQSRSTSCMLWEVRKIVIPSRLSSSSRRVDAVGRRRIQPGRRFVQKEDAGVVQDGAGQERALLHPPGEGFDRASFSPHQIDPLQQLVDAPRVDVVEPAIKLEVLLDRQAARRGCSGRARSP